MATKPLTPKLAPLNRALSDSDFDEQSAVRQRSQQSAALKDASGSTETRRFAAGASPFADRNTRIDHKIRLARTLLATLPGNEPRVRLLNIAILRRDEVLLTGVLESLRALKSEDSDDQARATILPPPPTPKR